MMALKAFIPLLLTVLIGTMAVGEEDQEAGWTTFQRPATQSTRQPNVDDDIVDIDVNYIETCDTLNTTLIYLDNGDELELLGKVTVVFRIVPHFLYHDQVEMLRQLWKRFDEFGYKALQFIVVTAYVRRKELRHRFESEVEKIAQNGGISLIKEVADRWPVLGMGNNQAYIIDECGRLTYIIVPPWSHAQFPYVKAAVLSTLFDVPCGDCEMPFLSQPYPGYGGDLGSLYYEEMLHMSQMNKHTQATPVSEATASTTSSDPGEELQGTSTTEVESPYELPDGSGEVDPRFNFNLEENEQLRTSTTEEVEAPSVANDESVTSTEPSLTSTGQSVAIEDPKDDYDQFVDSEEMQPDWRFYSSDLFIKDEDVESFNDPEQFLKYRNLQNPIPNDTIDDETQNDTLIDLPLRIIIPVEHVHRNILEHSHTKFNYIVLNTSANADSNAKHTHLKSDRSDELRKVVTGDPEFIKAKRLLNDSTSTDLYVNQMGQIYALLKEYQVEHVGELNEVTLLDTDIIRDEPKIVNIKAGIDLKRHYNLLIQWLNWQFED